MASTQNYFSEFLESQQRFTSWPTNLLQTSQFEHELEVCQERLATAGSELFHSRHRTLCLLDYSDVTESFTLSQNLGDLDQLRKLMNENTKDLKCRYVLLRCHLSGPADQQDLTLNIFLHPGTILCPLASFVHARSSRDSLSIAKEQLLHILTHHQAMPEFIDHVFTFCRRETPHLQTAFSVDDHLGLYQPTLRIDELGRSGLLAQHCFNLVGIEKETSKDPNWPYFLRQTAAYQSFDLIGGQTFWIILKGNQAIRDRIQKEADGRKRRHCRGKLETAEVSLSMSLSTHLLMFRWCAENWSSYIDFVQSKTQRLAAHTMLSPVAEGTKEEVIASTLHSRQNSGFSVHSRASRSTSFGEKIRLSPSPKSSPVLPSWESTLTAALENKPKATEMKDLNLDKMFSFDQLQSLHHHAERLEEAGLVISQNRRVIRGIVSRFEELKKSATLRMHLQTEEVNFEGFIRGANACLRELDNQYDRLQIMLTGLDKVMALFNGILQYKNMQTGQVFAKQANASTYTMEQLSFKMHDIAVRTKRDTISMHAITIMTLFFLPGTFVATFFSTGILNFDGDSMTRLGDWTTRPAALKLFIVICLPLMVFVLVAWWIAYLRSERQPRDTVGPEDGTLDKLEQENRAIATIV